MALEFLPLIIKLRPLADRTELFEMLELFEIGHRDLVLALETVGGCVSLSVKQILHVLW